MKLVDSLIPAKKKSIPQARKTLRTCSRVQLKSSRTWIKTRRDKKKVTFLALVVLSVTAVFIGWLFFLKLELRYTAEGGAFSSTFSDLRSVVQVMRTAFSEIKEIDFGELTAKNKNANTNISIDAANNSSSCSKREIDPEIQKLEERVFPQFED